MRIFETVPPSVVLVSAVVMVGVLTVGLEFAVFAAIWLAVIGVGNWLDLYGVPHHE